MFQIFKVFADNKIKVTEKLKFGLGTVENTVGKGENAGHQHFLLFQQCFQKASFWSFSHSVFKRLFSVSGDFVVKIKAIGCYYTIASLNDHEEEGF